MPRSGPGRSTAIPRTETDPRVARSKPAMMRSSVDLPHPDAPSRHTNSPAPTERSISRKASTGATAAGKLLSTPATRRIGGPAACSGGALGKSSGMMLRAPAQEMVAQPEQDPVGHEAGHADDDHAGDHQIGARQRAAVHDDRAEAFGDAGHL